MMQFDGRGKRVQLPALPMDLKQPALVFKALSDVTRIRILLALCIQEQCVGSLQKLTDRSQPQVSSNLRILKAMGLVECRTDGRFRLYSLKSELARKMLALVATDGKH